MGLLSLMGRVLKGSQDRTEEQTKAVFAAKAKFGNYKRTFSGVTGAFSYADWAKGRTQTRRPRDVVRLGLRTERRNRMRAFFVGAPDEPGREERVAQLRKLTPKFHFS